MSVSYCLFDSFPVEIIHMIFDYLSTCDIVNGFLKQSSYINSIVFNYNFYQINFRSILKSDFDLICYFLKAKQMRSLILSDGIETPHQSNLFFSLFNFEEFYFTLRCLVLDEINDQSIELILNHLNHLKNLSSLTILNQNLTSTTTLKQIFSRLIRLNISSQCFFNNITSMNQLKHLIIFNQCTFNQLETLINHVPNLISLNISIERENGVNIPHMISNITRLVINMSESQMNMISMKHLLCCFSRLISFEIECRCDIDLCNGHEWEIFLQEKLPYLKRFDFKFQLRSTLIVNTIEIENILHSYSSSYWLNDKHWFIAIEWNQRLIYSIPRFSCQSADSNFRPPFHCTTCDHSMFYDNINALAAWGQSKHRFLNVKELWLVDDPLMMNLELMINLQRIQRLIFVSSKIDFSLEIFIDLIEKMVNLNCIQFYDIPLSFNEYKDGIVLKQIRSIELIRELKSFSLIEILNKLFPQIERLKLKIQSNEDIEKVLKLFSKTLSIIIFHCDTTNIFINQKSIENILHHSNFTFQIDENYFRLWIGLKKMTNTIQIEKRRTMGCFSWCSTRKSLHKR